MIFAAYVMPRGCDAHINVFAVFVSQPQIRVLGCLIFSKVPLDLND